MSLISSLKIISVVKQDQSIFLWIDASVVDTAINSNGIKRLLANVLSTFPLNDNPLFNNGPKSLPKNPPDCTMLCNWVFDNFILSEELFGKALRSFETCVLVNKNLCGKLFSLLESWQNLMKDFFYRRFQLIKLSIR